MYVCMHIPKMHLIKSELLKNHFLLLTCIKYNYSNTAESFIKKHGNLATRNQQSNIFLDLKILIQSKN